MGERLARAGAGALGHGGNATGRILCADPSWEAVLVTTTHTMNCL